MSFPLEAALSQYLDPSIPSWGPQELELDPPFIPLDIPSSKNLPGKGLAEHDMLYIGEGCNRIFLIRDGKVQWQYDTGAGWELDDLWMLTNGNIIFTRMYWAAEVTSHKDIVWYMKAPENTEIHTLVPIGLDRVAVVINFVEGPRLWIIHKPTGTVESDQAIPFWGKPNNTHGQSRRFRITPQGTYLVSYLTGERVVEFDRDFNELWSYPVGKPWAAIRLLNGNTLISDETDQSVIEVSPEKKIVWKLTQEDLGPYRLEGTQSCVRLDNGNTILCARGENGRSPQLVEVTPDKKVVWVLNDWKTLGPATAIQVLTESGIPENPGECQR